MEVKMRELMLAAIYWLHIIATVIEGAKRSSGLAF